MSIKTRFQEFFFKPAFPGPFIALRIGLSAVLLLQAMWIAPSFFGLYSSGGFLQSGLNVVLTTLPLPRMGWILMLTAPLGFSEPMTLAGMAGIYLTSLVLLMWGWKPRLWAALAWFTHLIFMNSSFASNYGVDQFANIFLFYLSIFPSSFGQLPSSLTRLGLRLMQLNLCLAYAVTGLKKSLGVQWWSGEAIWRTLMLPEYQNYDMAWLAQYPWVAVAACWSTLLIEVGYPIFIWPKRTRTFWILGIVSLHLGVYFLMRLESFSLLMCVLTPALFGISPEKVPKKSLAKFMLHIQHKSPIVSSCSKDVSISV